MKPKLSLIIPAKNEEKRIARTLSNYGLYFESRQNDLDVEIIVVINNSSDNTSFIVEGYTNRFPFIKKIETVYKSGKGGAVSIGFSEATGDYIGYFDADGAVSASEIYKLFEFIHETPWLDGVIGNRYGGDSVISFGRGFLSRLFNTYVELLFNLDYRDTQCAAKIFRRKKAKILGKKLSSTGWAFDVNILLLCKYLNFQILQRPVKWVEKHGSKFSLFEAFIKVPLEFLYLKRLEISYYAKSLIPNELFSYSKQETPPVEKNILIMMWRDMKHPERGGSETYTHEVAKRLAKKHNVIWFTAQPSNLGRRDKVDGINIYRRGGLITVYFWAVYYYLFKFRKHVDFVIDTENGMSFFTPLYVSKPKLFIIYHIHGVMWFKEWFFPLSLFGYVLEKYIMPLVYKEVPIITISPSSKKEVSNIGLPEKHIYLAYSSIPKKYGIKYNKSEIPLILYHGRLKVYKRVDVAIEAFKKLLVDFPNAKFLISGSGSHYDYLKHLIRKLKLESSVEMLGYISDREKWILMQKAWVFVMPSVVEGWGITVMEAASCGTPSVGFNVPGIRDSIKNHFTGYLANDKRHFYELVRKLIGDKNLRQSFSENCVSWVNLFSWKKTTDIIEYVIDNHYTKDELLAEKLFPWDLEPRPGIR